MDMISVPKNLSVLTNLYRFLIEEEAMDDVKEEKDVAMRRFNRRRKIKWLFEFAAVFFVLARSSGYWIPIFSDLLRETVAIFRSHLFVFALFNFLIAAVYALSTGIPRSPIDAAPEQSDLYYEFVTNSRKISAVEKSPSPKTVVSENVDAIPKIEAENENENEKALVVVEVNAKSQLQFGIHQRTRSESFGSRNTTAETATVVGEESRKEFRRSYTEVRRKLTPATGKSNAVNRMSDEDFNRRIEDFIATQKLIQQEEFKEERKTQRFNVALTTTTAATTVCQ